MNVNKCVIACRFRASHMYATDGLGSGLGGMVAFGEVRFTFTSKIKKSFISLLISAA